MTAFRKKAYMSQYDYFELKTVKESSGGHIIDTKRQKREGRTANRLSLLPDMISAILDENGTKIIEVPMSARVFSENVVFFDAEFTSLDPRRGEILSIAIVKPSGEELYLEIDRSEDLVHPWVRENILPLLDGDPISPDSARERVEHFIGDSTP
ncbi:MAG: hypothetical protein HGA16_02535, partial [Candidatus Moranbacteria bacterium]|nr:hypothetical protein [Candidatus Moranbacteria bacterium]